MFPNKITKFRHEQQIVLQVHQMKVWVFFNIKILVLTTSTLIHLSVNSRLRIGSICWHLCHAANWPKLCPKLGTVPGSHNSDNNPNSGERFFFRAHILSHKIFSEQNFCWKKFKKYTQTRKTIYSGKYEPKNYFSPLFRILKFLRT
jgi:hypothetical protein